MRLFISYARVDQRFCTQLLELLEAHEWWYDQRLWAGEKWWQKIMEQIEWCDALLFLVSPDSLRSKWCMEEFNIAREKNKYIIPIQIEPCDEIPADLLSTQFVDMKQGQTIAGVRELLNALLVAERAMLKPALVASEVSVDKAPIQPKLPFNPHTFLPDALKAYDEGDFETSVFLLSQAITYPELTKVIDIKPLLKKAQDKLERKSYLRHVEREYKMIGEMLKHQFTRDLGVEALQKFRQQFPEHDPDNLTALILPLYVPNLTWCDIPEGEVTLEFPERNKRVTYYVPEFQMSKYPITNAQYQFFVDAQDGYRNARWWEFSQEAIEWRKAHPTAMTQRTLYGDHPRVNVTYYEARAFCLWLSQKTGWRISLPSEEQWQRAAQGNDGRQYPWGNRFYYQLCNCQESKIGKTTRVGHFPKGSSPFGIFDLAGNIWEWCINREYGTESRPHAERVTKGGSYSSHYKRIRTTYRLPMPPGAAYGTIGFRVVVNRRK